ncbi:MAG TPA: lipid-A-disaccharide synthase, partial [Casimicrobiaceae bacterium]|nr:lipid-A-disaccharide synthase [Casimicrobiaceae bacterium]
MRDSTAPPTGGPLVGIVAGEASGDALAAALIRAVRERHPHVRFAGIAGPKMQAEGCDAWVPMEKLAVRGFAEVVAHLPELFGIRRDLRRRLLHARVPLFIGVDAPDFNLGLEAKLKARGVRTIHFVSPSVWAWRGERVQSIARAVDRMLALFPFEPPLYAAAGVTVDYVGHPMAADAATPATRRDVRERFHLGPATPVFALLPGSRLSEIDMHAETVLRTASRIHEMRPDAQFLVPLVTRATRDRFDDIRHRLDLSALPITLLYGHADDALRAADVGLVASGTATLEAALARCPHVIFYKVTRLTAWIVQRRLSIPYVGLPNVLAGRFVVPEFLQDDASPVNLAQALVNLFDDSVTRRRLDALFAG